MKLNAKQLTQSLKALLMLSPMVAMALPLGAIAAPRPEFEFCGAFPGRLQRSPVVRGGGYL